MTSYFDPERYPTLSDEGAEMLRYLTEHPNAPIYRDESGNRLTAADLDELKALERKLTTENIDWAVSQHPSWLEQFLEYVYREVPYYRAQGTAPAFRHIQSISRAHLSADIAAFVPDDIPIERMINFRTTGTSGNPLLLASHPRVAATYLLFHQRALRRFGVELEVGANHVGVVLVGHQTRCFTYVSVTPMLGESGLAKINLHPNDWRHPDDRTIYLDALNPEVYTGDPLTFNELKKLPLTTRPKALISVGMMMSAGMRADLEAHFNAPVLDIYSLNEAGPIAVFGNALDGHLILQTHLYVEILDSQGNTVEPGIRGEITLSGGFNFCLPLVRYRTGDYAALVDSPEGPVLKELSGRAPVRYQLENGEWINNIDVTHALRPIPLAQFGLHQNKDKSLVLYLAPSSMTHHQRCLEALKHVFGNLVINVKQIEKEDKILQYTSDLIEGFIQ